MEHDLYTLKIMQLCYDGNYEEFSKRHFIRYKTMKLSFVPYPELCVTFSEGGWAKLSNVTWNEMEKCFEASCEKAFIYHEFDNEFSVSKKLGWQTSNIVSH